MHWVLVFNGTPSRIGRGSLLNHLVAREEWGRVHLCDGNRDRSRMQTTLKRVARGNGQDRAAWYAWRRVRHMCRFLDMVYVSGRASARDRSPKNVHPPDFEHLHRFSVTPGIVKSLARCR